MDLQQDDIAQIEGTVAIIVAAGIGSRMQVDTPKQYLKINRQTLLDITLDKFLNCQKIELIVLVIAPDDAYYKHLNNVDNEKIIIIDGGDKRIHSVHNGLKFLYDQGLADKTGVMIHDAARPCITATDLDKLAASYAEKQAACMLVAPVVDSLHKVNAENNQVMQSVCRDNLYRALTPQMASLIDLKLAIKDAIAQQQFFSDDASALIAAGISVNAVIGRSDNIKVTHHEDLALIEFYLDQQNL